MIEFFEEEKVRDIFKDKQKFYKGKKFLPILGLLFDDLEQVLLCKYCLNSDIELLLKKIFNEEEITVDDIVRELYPILANGPSGIIYFCWPNQLEYTLELFCDHEEQKCFIENKDFKRAICDYVQVTWTRIFDRRIRPNIARKHLHFYPKEVFESDKFTNYAQKVMWIYRMNEIDRFFSWSDKYLSQMNKVRLYKGTRDYIASIKLEGLNPVDEMTVETITNLMDESLLSIRQNNNWEEDEDKKVMVKQQEQVSLFKKMEFLMGTRNIKEIFKILSHKGRKKVKKS